MPEFFFFLQCQWYFINVYGKVPGTELNFSPIANICSWKSPQVISCPIDKTHFFFFFFAPHLKSSNPGHTTIYSFPAWLYLMGTEALLMPLTKVPHVTKFFISYMLLDILLSVERQCHRYETSYKIESI